MMTAEQIVSAQKANIETLFGLSGLAFEGVEKLIELNTQVAKTALTEASADDPGRPVGQGRARAAGPASRPAPARRREGRRLRPPPV